MKPLILVVEDDEQIRRFVVLDHDFTLEGGDLTAYVSYRLVSRLARQHLPAEVVAYQFEVRLEPTSDAAMHCMLQSPVMST